MSVCTNCKGTGFEITEQYADEHGNETTCYTMCSKCYGTGNVPATNADRIRAMNDVELGCFLASVEDRRKIFGGGAIWKGPVRAIEWLKQPAEEGGK